MVLATCLFLTREKKKMRGFLPVKIPARLVVTAQICEFGNLGCIPGNFTGCVRDLEEVNGLATS